MNILLKYSQSITELHCFFMERDLDFNHNSVPRIERDSDKLEFVTLFEALQRARISYMMLPSKDANLDDMVGRCYGVALHWDFVAAYLDLVEVLKIQSGGGGASDALKNTYFNLCLFNRDRIDVDWSFSEVANKRRSLTDIIRLAGSTSGIMTTRKTLVAFLRTLNESKEYTVDALHKQYKEFKLSCYDGLEYAINKYGVTGKMLNLFVVCVVETGMVCGELVTKLFDDNDVTGWKERAKRETGLVKSLAPLIKFKAQGRHIEGLSLYC